MNTSFTHLAAALAIALAFTENALAGPMDPIPYSYPWYGSYAVYDPTSGYMGGSSDVTGEFSPLLGTFTVASTTPFFGANWTATGGTLYGPGTYTISTADPTCGNSNCASGSPYTFTVGAGQIGGSMKFSWNVTGGIDVVQVWNVTAGPGGQTVFTTTDLDADGLPGMTLVEGPFIGLGVAFNLTAVPEASTYAMLLAGLGLVGAAARRRQQSMG